MKNRILLFAAGLALASVMGPTPSRASVVTVDAKLNSSSGGTGVAIDLAAGEHFVITVSPTDLWSAGDVPRWSNADGLTHDLFATGTDETGQPAHTLIGVNWGLYGQGNLSAPYGTLVGETSAGHFFLIGTSYAGSTVAADTLKLFYWDSNNGDNTGSIAVNVSAVPEPSTWAMLTLGFFGVGFSAYRRQRRSTFRFV
jgi:PEP-CTERM motif